MTLWFVNKSTKQEGKNGERTLNFNAAEKISINCAEQRELALSWLSANWRGSLPRASLANGVRKV